MADAYHHGNLRAELLERAIETLGQKGIDHLSLRALARDLGVSHAAPLRHFKTKQDLLNAIAVEGVQSLIAATKVAEAYPRGVARLRAMMLAYVRWALSNAELHRVLRHQDVMRHASDELTDLLEGFATRQREEIAAAQEAGWRTHEDAGLLFFHIVCMTAGTAIVATEEVYRERVRERPTEQKIVASIDMFFGESGR